MFLTSPEKVADVPRRIVLSAGFNGAVPVTVLIRTPLVPILKIPAVADVVYWIFSGTNALPVVVPPNMSMRPKLLPLRYKESVRNVLTRIPSVDEP